MAEKKQTPKTIQNRSLLSWWGNHAVDSARVNFYEGLIHTQNDPSLDYMNDFYSSVVFQISEEIISALEKKIELPPYAGKSVNLAGLVKTLGLTGMTFRQYEVELAKLGFNIKALHARTLKERAEFDAQELAIRSKASTFFSLIKADKFVTDEQVRHYIDRATIYFILELAVDHIDTMRARVRAYKSHREDHDSKAMVFLWLDKHFNKSKSMDNFALELAGKLVPYKFRAVRDWLTEWKKLRSAGKP